MDFFNIQFVRRALVMFFVTGFLSVSNEGYSQCKEARSRTTGEITKYFRIQAKGAAEQIVVSNTSHRYKITYENRLNNDPRFRVKVGDELTITSDSGTFSVPITESINVANGYNVSAELSKEDLIKLRGFQKITFPASSGGQLVVLNKRKSQKLSIAINCLNQ